MSNREETPPSTEGVDTSRIYAFLQRRYYVIALVVAMAFMFWSRFQAYDRFLRDDGGIWLQAVDSWYHWRTTEWTVANFPGRILVDPWTSFPDGHLSGQFGTLFDLIVGTVAMVIGLGDPSAGDIHLAALITVPVMAALVALPVFYIGRRLGGTIGGLTGVVLLALAPGTFFFRTTTGQFQHHVAEVLFMAVAVLAMMVAIRSAEVNRPIYELLVAKEWEPLKWPAIYSAIAGFATALYILSWPPGVVLVGIFGLFFVVQLSIDFVNQRSPDHLTFVGVISMVVVSLFTALAIQESGFSATGFDYFQPTFPLLVAAGCLFMAGLARLWERQDIDRRGYPAAIAGSIVVALGALALILPDVYSTLMGNLSGRMIPFGHSPSALTVAEVQPPADYTAHVSDEFGTAFYTMLAGLALLVARPFLGRDYRAEYTLVIIWSLVLISMSMTQSRFAYYLVLAVATVNAVFVADVVKFFSFDIHNGVQSLKEVETYQILVLVMVVLLLFAPLLPPIAGATAWDRGDQVTPSGDAVKWEESNHWMAENTPEPGDWGGAGNADDLEYHGHYEFDEDGTFAYPEGAYGVISWWDYGHLINVQGERMAHSNPFQANADSSSAFLTAQSEERAELILDAVAAGEEPDDHTDEELEAMAADAGHEEIRYAMIDDQMAGGKFSAIATWTGPEPASYYDTRPITIGDQQEELPAPNEQYYDTMTASLYLDDATGLENYRLVHESSDFSIVGSQLLIDPQTGQAQVREGASEGIQGESWDDVEELAEQMQMSRLTGQAMELSPTMYMYDAHVVSSVKSFERVDGATITGEVDDEELEADDTTVTATVPLETNTDRGFTYSQEVELNEDGTFELTVPYATDEDRGVEDGYTDSAVSATADYTVSVESPGDDGAVQHYAGDLEVAESAVYDGETLEVTLEEVDEEVEDEDDEDELEDEDLEDGELDEGDLEDGDGAEVTE